MSQVANRLELPYYFFLIIFIYYLTDDKKTGPGLPLAWMKLYNDLRDELRTITDAKRGFILAMDYWKRVGLQKDRSTAKVINREWRLTR